jgi:hypothetical protein
MTDDLRFTRRGVLQMMSAILATASFAARRPLFASSLIEPPLLEAEVVHEEQFITDAARGAKIERFLRSRGIKPAQLAHESGYSRQHLLRIRLGRIRPSARCAAQLLAACRRLTREAISASDLFDLSFTGIRAIERIHGRSAD